MKDRRILLIAPARVPFLFWLLAWGVLAIVVVSSITTAQSSGKGVGYNREPVGAPGQPGPKDGKSTHRSDPTCNSLIETQDQALGEDLPLVGTPFGLHYHSDRVPGCKVERSLWISLSGDPIPKSLKQIVLEVRVTGQQITKDFPAKTNQSYVFTWDGKDAEGRISQVSEPLTFRIGYVYDGTYKQDDASELSKKGVLTDDRGHNQFSLWQEMKTVAGGCDARGQGLGGWSLSVHHAYDPVKRVVYMGDGRRRSASGGPSPEVMDRLIAATKRGAGWEHDQSQNPKFVVFSEDGSELYQFNATGRHLVTLDAISDRVIYSFSYDQEGRLTKVDDEYGNATVVKRDVKGNATAIVAPFGQRNELTLDAEGYLVRLSNPAGEATELTYHDGGLLATFKDPRGNTSRFTFDEMGRLTRDENAADGFVALTRTEDGKGFTIAITTAGKPATTYRVEQLPKDEERRLNKCCCGAETVVLFTADGGRKTTHPDGTVSVQIMQPDPRWGMQSPGLKSALLTTPLGRKMTVSAERRVILADPANPLSLTNLNDTVSINGRDYTSTFDVVRRQITRRTPTGRQVVTTLDDHDRVSEIEAPGRLPIDFKYDDRGRLTTIAQGSGAEARVVVISYDAQGRFASMTDPLKRTTRFEYDLADRIKKQILPDGRAIAYGYDANGNQTSITPPGRPAHAFEYTSINQVKGYLPPDIGAPAKNTSYVYNKDKQLTQVNRPDGATIDLAYDKVGQLQALSFPGGKLQLALNSKKDQITTLTTADGGTLSYTYDGFLRTKTTWDGAVKGSISRKYDNEFRVVAVTVNANPPISYKYDADGLMTQAGKLALNRDPQSGLITGSKLGNVTTEEAYTGFGERKHFAARYKEKDLYNVEYERDLLGRIVKMTESIEGQTSVFTYVYDLAGRLTDVATNGTNTAHYEFDSNGNRLSYKGQNGTLTGTYDAQDRINKYGNNTYSHTANGEWAGKTVEGKTTTYGYDALGNLMTIDLPAGERVENLIDGAHRHIGERINGKLVRGFLYQDELRPAAELDGNNKMITRFIYGIKVNVPEYIEKDGRTHRIITDHLGSPRLILDAANGETVQRLDYDEFGNVLHDTSPSFQPFGFAGGIYTPRTALTRFGQRDLDAFTGRWTAKDPIGFLAGDANLYAYVNQDPITFADPSGLMTPASVAEAVNRARVEAVINGPSNSPSGNSFIKDVTKVFKQGWEGDSGYPIGVFTGGTSPFSAHTPYYPPGTPHLRCFLKPGALYRGNRDGNDVPPGLYGNPLSGGVDPQNPNNPPGSPTTIGISEGIEW